MNTLRTFILFIFIIGISLLFSAASIGKKNSLITNSEVLEASHKSSSFFLDTKYFYPNSSLISDSPTSVVFVSDKPMTEVVKWYRNSFRNTNNLTSYDVVNSSLTIQDDKKYVLYFAEKMNKTVVTIRIY